MSIIWIHEDAITLDHPVICAAGDDAKALFAKGVDGVFTNYPKTLIKELNLPKN